MEWIVYKQDNEAVDDDRDGDEEGDLAGGKDGQKGGDFWIQVNK